MYGPNIPRGFFESLFIFAALGVGSLFVGCVYVAYLLATHLTWQ